MTTKPKLSHAQLSVLRELCKPDTKLKCSTWHNWARQYWLYSAPPIKGAIHRQTAQKLITLGYVGNETKTDTWILEYTATPAAHALLAALDAKNPQ